MVLVVRNTETRSGCGSCYCSDNHTIPPPPARARKGGNISGLCINLNVIHGAEKCEQKHLIIRLNDSFTNPVITGLSSKPVGMSYHFQLVLPKTMGARASTNCNEHLYVQSSCPLLGPHLYPSTT